MEKSKLQSFINRYYLAGNCEAVTVKANEESVNCELIDIDQTVVGKVKWKTDPFMQGELGINHTGALTKMLSAVGEKIDIEVNESQGKNYAMKIKEGSTTMTFMLADTSVIPAVPAINAEPDDNVTFEIDGTANDLDAICFSADKLKEVLTANKGDKGTMHISSNGLARIDFTGTDFESNYWLVQLQN